MHRTDISGWSVGYANPTTKVLKRISKGTSDTAEPPSGRTGTQATDIASSRK